MCTICPRVILQQSPTRTERKIRTFRKLNHRRNSDDWSADGKKLVSADRADLALPKSTEPDGDKDGDSGQSSFNKEETESLLGWLKKALENRVADVIESKRLVDSPAMIVNPDGHMTSTMERVLAMSRQEKGGDAENSKKNLEVNLANPLIQKLAEVRDSDDDFAKEIAEQILDNAMIQAGLIVNPLDMVERNYRILNRAVKA